MSFGIGESIVCVYNGNNRYLTKGYAYEALGMTVTGNREFVQIRADDGELHYYYASRFRKSTVSLARSTDPATSKGKRKVNKYEQAVLQWLVPGDKNGKEIAESSGYPLNCITPRFAPLRRKGLIEQASSEQGVGIKRDKQIVWRLKTTLPATA